MRSGELVKRARMKRKLSQLSVAIELGYKSSQFISNWERGLAYVPAEKAKSVSDFLGINFTVLKKSIEQDAVELMQEDFECGK